MCFSTGSSGAQKKILATSLIIQMVNELVNLLSTIYINCQIFWKIVRAIFEISHFAQASRRYELHKGSVIMLNKSIVCTYLHSSLCQIYSHGELFSVGEKPKK